MADRVLASATPSERRGGETPLHDAGHSPRPPGTLTAGGGQPLSATHRSFFQPRLGEDLGGVRLHTGPEADRATRALDARAYAFGEHIVLGRNGSAAAPERRVLAHELAHVVQQRRTGRPAIMRLADAKVSCAQSDTAKLEALRGASNEAVSHLNTAIAKISDIKEQIRRNVVDYGLDVSGGTTIPGHWTYPLVDDALRYAGMDPDSVSVWLDDGPCTVSLLLTRLEQIRGLLASDLITYNCGDEAVRTFCGSTTIGPPDCDDTYAMACPDGSFEVLLCPDFWTPGADKSGTLIHEAAHLGYADVDETHSGNISNAFCYERIVEILTPMEDDTRSEGGCLFADPPCRGPNGAE